MRCCGTSAWMLSAAMGVMAVAGAHGQTPETSPAPGEEVMRPTQRGLRLTPALARAITAGILSSAGDLEKLELTSEQRELLAEAAARRLMSLAHRDGREAQAGVEYLIETAMASMDGGEFKIRDYREFADKMQPLVRTGRELVKGLREDAGPILNAEQMKQIEKLTAEADQGMSRLEQRLEDCRAGRFVEGKNPLDDLDDEQADKPTEPKVSAQVRQAENQARWETYMLTTWNWSSFLAGATVAFKFDEAQKAKGRAVLKEFEKKADAIQTPEWKARVKQNRVLVHLRQGLNGVPAGPYMYRLDKEYNADIRPLKELTGGFYKEVLGLATPEQRAQALGEVRNIFEKFGVNASDEDRAWLEGLLQ